MQANRLALPLAGAAVIVLGLLAAACNSTQSAQNASNKQTKGSVPATHAAATTGYNPNIDPANFVKKIDNPLFPLKPGTKNELQSKTSDGVGHETLTVTHDTTKIAGVTTTVSKGRLHAGRQTGGEDYRLVCPGQAGQRVVLRRRHRHLQEERQGRKHRGDLEDRG